MVDLADFWKGENGPRQLIQFVLLSLRHEELPERPETPALVRVPDQVLAFEYVVKEFTFFKARINLFFPYSPVELAEVVFYLAEVRQEFSSRFLHFEKTFLDLSFVQAFDDARLDLCNFPFDFLLLPGELFKPLYRVSRT